MRATRPCRYYTPRDKKKIGLSLWDSCEYVHDISRQASRCSWPRLRRRLNPMGVIIQTRWSRLVVDRKWWIEIFFSFGIFRKIFCDWEGRFRPLEMLWSWESSGRQIYYAVLSPFVCILSMVEVAESLSNTNSIRSQRIKFFSNSIDGNRPSLVRYHDVILVWYTSFLAIHYKTRDYGEFKFKLEINNPSARWPLICNHRRFRRITYVRSPKNIGNIQSWIKNAFVSGYFTG